MTSDPAPPAAEVLSASVTSPLSTAERGAIIAFAIIDGIAFTFLAIPYAMWKSADKQDSFDPGFAEAFLRGAASWGFWFSALALPVAVLWIAMSSKAERKHSLSFELARTTLVSCAFILLLALTTVVVGPDSKGGHVIHASDLVPFGRALIYGTIAALPLCGILRGVIRWWFADLLRTPRAAPVETT